MKIKKLFSAFILTALFSAGTAFAGSTSFENPPPVFGFTVSEGAAFSRDGAFLQTSGGIFLSNNPCLPDIGPVLGLLDYEIFADYFFKTDFSGIFDSSVEAGVSASLFFFNAALVPVWHINDSSFDFDYRIGSRIGLYDLISNYSGFGGEFFAYFQAPFTSIEDFEVSLGIKLRLSTQEI